MLNLSLARHPALITLGLAAALLVGPSGYAQVKPKPKPVVREDSVVAIADVVDDKTAGAETMRDDMLPSWSVENARALQNFIDSIGSEGLFSADYAPQQLGAAITTGPGPALDRVAAETFLLVATHLRDGRTPNAARKQWFMVDQDSAASPLAPLMVAALASGDMAGVLQALNPTHPSFAALRSALATARDKAGADQLRVNMERWRWMSRDTGDRYIMTNVPEFLTRVVHSGKLIATHKAVVGKLDTATPQLDALATGVIINPTWTLPRSIINEGIGATIASRPAVARSQGYSWTGTGPTLSVVQRAGPGNALGMMKLEMINPHAIYLHDTPSKSAFAAANRAFSHGCIRTERALHFSGLMAVVFAGRSPEEFGEAYASGETTRFGFDDPFPVYIAYWTLAPGADGKLVRFNDLYGRDAPVVASFARPGRATATKLIAPPPPPAEIPIAPMVPAEPAA